MSQIHTDTTSLNKFISDTGYCSRREADKIIKEGRVTINGVVAILGNRVGENDTVLINGKPLNGKELPIYIAFHKPVGVTCTTETNVMGNIISFINHPKRIFPIGRLDKPSEGLIFLTNDGDIVNKILRAGNNHEKEYWVKVDKPVTDDFIKKMGAGVPILDTVTKRCFVEKTDKFGFKIILTQGLNRQIRRMCEYFGYEVVRLKRTRIMNVTMEKIPVGTWRYLTEMEMAAIERMLAGSSKTMEASVVDGDLE